MYKMIDSKHNPSNQPFNVTPKPNKKRKTARAVVKTVKGRFAVVKDVPPSFKKAQVV